MATIMELESLLNLIAYAESIVLLRVESSAERDEAADFLASKRREVRDALPNGIGDVDDFARPIQAIIKKYENNPVLEKFQ